MEVFSRRTRSTDPRSGAVRPGSVFPSTEQEPQVTFDPPPRNVSVALSPARLNTLFATRLNDLCARFEEWTLPLVVTGRLGTVPPDTWRRYEPLPLQDLESKEEIGLEVTYEQLEKSAVHAGDIVEATGFLRVRLVRGQAMLRFETLALRPHRKRSERLEGNAVQLLETLHPERHDFPTHPDLGMLLVDVASGTDMLDKLQETLSALQRQGALRSLVLGPADRQALLQALLQRSEDVIVLLLSSASAPLLEHPAVVKALAACPAYRVVVQEAPAAQAAGLSSQTEEGSLAPTALVGWVADRVFESSLEAGRYLRERYSTLWQVREETRAREEELAALRDSMAQLVDLPEAARVAGMKRGLMVGMLLGAVLCVALVLVLVFALHGGSA